jgi:hypothetical protein
MTSPFSRASGRQTAKVYSGRGADIVMQSSGTIGRGPQHQRRNKTQDRNSSTDNVAKFHVFAEPHDVVRSPGVVEQVGVDAC